jgi:hypothetical protein
MKPIHILLLIMATIFLTACDVSLTEEDITQTYRKFIDTLVESEGLAPETQGVQTRVPVVDVGNQLSTPAVTPGVPINDSVCNLAVSGMPIDVTIPDGTRLRPGQTFSKTWRLVNAGSCTWGQGYSAVWFSGELLSSARHQFFRSVVPPGQSVDITVEMTAPKKAGIYQSNWKLSDQNTNLFGIGPNGDAPFWVLIEVIDEVHTATATITATATSVPAVYTAGEFLLSLDERVNLDTGELNSGNQDDLTLLMDVDKGLVLAVEGSARFMQFGSLRPNDQDCRSLTLSSDPISLELLTTDDYVCYRTGQALPGFFRLVETDLEENSLMMEYVTWAVP